MQALGCLEADAGNVEVARELFRTGCEQHPQHLHLWQVELLIPLAFRLMTVGTPLHETVTY